MYQYVGVFALGLAIAGSLASIKHPAGDVLIAVGALAMLVFLICAAIEFKRRSRLPKKENDSRIEAAMRTVEEKKGNDDMPISETTYWADKHRPYRVPGDMPLIDDQEIRILDGVYRVDFIDVHPRVVPGSRGGQMQMVKDVYVTLVSREFWPY